MASPRVARVAAHRAGPSPSSRGSYRDESGERSLPAPIQEGLRSLVVSKDGHSAQDLASVYTRSHGCLAFAGCCGARHRRRGLATWCPLGRCTPLTGTPGRFAGQGSVWGVGNPVGARTVAAACIQQLAASMKSPGPSGPWTTFYPCWLSRARPPNPVFAHGRIGGSAGRSGSIYSNGLQPRVGHELAHTSFEHSATAPSVSDHGSYAFSTAPAGTIP